MVDSMVRTIGIDVHKDSYSLSAFDPRSTNFSAECAIAADSKSVINYVHKLRKEIGTPVSIEVGYEAGPTGFGILVDKTYDVKRGEMGNVSIGLPKWDNVREILLPQITLDALARLRPEKGRYFPYSYSWADEAIKHMAASICAAFPDDAQKAMPITCYVLRHSLNTALKLIGCPEIMLDQWFGWSEGRKTMQSRYTRIYAKDLKLRQVRRHGRRCAEHLVRDEERAEQLDAHAHLDGERPCHRLPGVASAA